MFALFLSIIIPVYNCGKFLEECLNSVFTQDIPQSDYEVICINDGSKDNSQSILEKFAAVHKNLHLISQENKGAAAARNEGLKKAVGDYIWFVDADDLICENILSLLKSKIEACNCDRMSFGFYYFDGNLTEEQRKGINISENGNGGYSVHCCTHLLRNRIIKENGLSFKYPELICSEDSVFLYEFNLCNPKIEILTGYVVYFYRSNPDSATHVVSPEHLAKKAVAHLSASKIFKRYYDDSEKNGTCGETISNLLASNLSAAVYESMSLPAKKRKIIFKELKKAGLFPLKVPKKSTLDKSYLTSRTDFLGKIFDFAYTRIYTLYGFAIMKIFKGLMDFKNRL